MKFSKIIAGMSAMVIMVTAAVSASATDINEATEQDKFPSVPENWLLQSGNAERVLKGAESDTPMFKNEEASKIKEVVTAEVSIQYNEDIGDEYVASGSIVPQSSANSWEMYTWSTDGTADAGVTVTDNGGGSYTISLTKDGGLYGADDMTLEGTWIKLCMQNFGKTKKDEEYDKEKNPQLLVPYSIESAKLLDASGNEVLPGGSGVEDESSAADDSSNTDSNSNSSDSAASGADSKTTNSTGGGSNTKQGGSTGGNSTRSSASPETNMSNVSDNTANAESGAAAGISLAIAALAGAAIVVSRKK